MAGPTLGAVLQFVPDYITALNDANGSVILLSSAKSFGSVADVKTPPEEVPFLEMPELLCTILLLGSMPLSDGEVFVVRGIRRVSRCTTEGPLLSLIGEVQPAALIDIGLLQCSCCVHLVLQLTVWR